MRFMELVRRARLYFGCTGEYALPVLRDDSVPLRDSAVWRGVLLARRAAAGGDEVGASALLRQLVGDGAPEQTDDEAMMVARIDAGVLDWWRGDVAAAREHFAEAVESCDPTSGVLLERARLNLACCRPDGRADAEALRAGPLAGDATVAVAVFHGREGRLGESLRTLGALGRPTPLATLNEAVVRGEAGDHEGALARFRTALEGLSPGPDHHRAITLLGWGNTGTLAAAGLTGAARDAAFTEAERHLVAAAELLRAWNGPHRLVADCLRNMGVLHLIRAADQGDREQLSLALGNHWAALEHYHRAPEAAPGRIGDQWRNLALCHDLLARLSPADAVRAARRASDCRAEAVDTLVRVHDVGALAEADLTEAALVLDRSPDAAVRLAVPAALFRAAQRFGFSGVDARTDWAEAEASHAVDLALRAAERAGEVDVASALVVTLRFGGVTDWGATSGGASAAWDASTQAAPPRIAGVSDALLPYIEAAASRYGIDQARLIDSVTIDLMVSDRDR